MSRWLSPLMAFCLSFIIIAGLAPSLDIQIDRQIDFWILWLVSMLVLALPITYLEVALAKRSKTTALNALSSLTRDADASQSWRIVGWLAVIFIPFLAGGILSNISQSTVTNGEFTDTKSSIVCWCRCHGFCFVICTSSNFSGFDHGRRAAFFNSCTSLWYPFTDLACYTFRI